MSKEHERETIAHFQQSRKAFLTEYIAFGVLFTVFMLTMLFKLAPQSFAYLAFILSLLALARAEALRFNVDYRFFQDKILITRGLLRRTKTSVYFHPLGFIPNIHVVQSQFQRMLNFGTIDIKEGERKPLEIRNVDNPHKVMELLESLIRRNRRV